MKKRPLLYQKLHEGPVIVLQDYPRMQVLHMHLYFVKALECKIIQDQVPLNIGRFSEVLLSGQPHKNVFLTFANMPQLEAPGDKLLWSCCICLTSLCYDSPVPALP